MSTLIIGSEGSMGKRYQTILKHLGEKYWCVDKQNYIHEILSRVMNSDRVILCTPTDTHFELLMAIIPLGVEVLCEKPVTKNLKELEHIFRAVEKHKTGFTMVHQYKELIQDPLKTGLTSYDYFRTGNDGLVWDCLQIIGLAKTGIELNNESPIWKCEINGEKLNLSDMDEAYVSFVRKWLHGWEKQSQEHLFSIHEKTERFHSAKSRKFN